MAHHFEQLRFAQWRHVDQPISGVNRFVLLQVAEEVGPHAHHRTQPRVAEALCEDLRESQALGFFGAHVKLLALVDVM